jgi:hypothetical protein
MCLQKLGQPGGVGLGLVHPQGQGAQPSEDEPGLVGVHGPPEEAQKSPDFSGNFSIIDDDHAPQDVAVAV